MVTTGGRREASLLLTTPLWQAIVPRLEGRPVVGIPSHDVFLVTGSEDAPKLARLRRKVAMRVAHGDHAETTHGFIFTERGMENVD